jgi:hypothetical protein
MIVEELVAVLGAKIEKGDFADAFALLDHLGGAFDAVFGAIEKGVTEAFKTVHEVAMMGDEIGSTAEQLGIAAGALQELGYAAKLSDADAEGLTAGLRFLSRAAAEAAGGSKEAQEALRGIKYSDAKGLLSVQDIFENVADKFATLPNGVEKVNLAMKLFGRQGASLIPMLNKGADGIAALRAEAQASGVVLSDSVLQASGAYDDAFKRLEGSIQGLKNQFAGPVIEKVTELFGRLRELLASPQVKRAVDGLSRGFGRLVDTLSLLARFVGWLPKLVDGFVSVVRAFDRFGVIADFFEWLFSVEGGIFAIATVLGALAAAALTAGASLVGAAISAAAAWLAAAAPFIALGALIALVVDDLYTFAEGGDSMLGRVIRWFNAINPEDNAFIRLLKTAGALLFDLTDPVKWQKLGQAIFDFALSPVRGIIDSLKWVLDLINKTAPGLKDPLSLGDKSFGDAMREKFPGLSDPLSLGDKSFGDAMREKFPGMAPVLPSSSTVSNRNNTTISAPITITVPPGTDAAGVAEAARTAVREELGAQLQDAHAANGGN